jgi:hypothetical protein
MIPAGLEIEKGAFVAIFTTYGDAQQAMGRKALADLPIVITEATGVQVVHGLIGRSTDAALRDAVAAVEASGGFVLTTGMNS